MTIRPMRANDLPQYGELCRYCFTSVLVFGPHQYMTWVGKFLQHSWAAFDGRTMQAGMWYYPYEMRIGEQYLPMGGVAAVATAPEFRNQGLVKTLMTKAHEQMLAEGRPLAVLMPFKASFYARMGYAMTYFHHEYEFAPGQLATQRETKASIRPIDGVKHWRTLEDVYQQFGTRYWGTVRRDATYWKWRWLRTAQGLRKVYLVERQEEPVGFVIATLAATNPNSQPDLSINQAAWIDGEALCAILSFIRAHRDQAAKIRWSLPVDIDLYPYFEELNIQVLRKPKMMLKLVDLKGALERRSFPPDLSGELVFEVAAESTSPWNEGRWRVTWDQGRASVRKIANPATGLPKLRCDIQTLATLYSGHRTATMLQTSGLLDAPAGVVSILDRAFPLAQPFMQEWF